MGSQEVTLAIGSCWEEVVSWSAEEGIWKPAGLSRLALELFFLFNGTKPIIFYVLGLSLEITLPLQNLHVSQIPPLH